MDEVFVRCVAQGHVVLLAKVGDDVHVRTSALEVLHRTGRAAEAGSGLGWAAPIDGGGAAALMAALQSAKFVIVHVFSIPLCSGPVARSGEPFTGSWRQQRQLFLFVTFP
jgi:hypothetical protein